MAFLDKLFKFKKKPFIGEGQRAKGIGHGGANGKQEKSAGTKSSKSLALSSTPHGSGKLAHVIIRPHISEKSSTLQALNKYVFEVNPHTTKHEVKLAIRDLYGVLPTIIKMINIRGKQLRFGRTSGQTKRWKKAIVTLPGGSNIKI